MKSGIGSAAIEIGEGIIVAALAAVNVFGDVLDPQSGKIVAGARAIHDETLTYDAPGYFADTMQVMKGLGGRPLRFARGENTAIGVVATNARLSKEHTNKVAQMAQDGLARAVSPAHTMLDGDTIFALSAGNRKADVNIVGAFAAEVFARAILRAVRMARPLAGLPPPQRWAPVSKDHPGRRG
jgi:L-aminopeptidase/D-esterase-like protein